MVASGSRRSIFLKGFVPDRLTTVQWKATYPRVSGQHNLVLMGLKRRRGTAGNNTKLGDQEGGIDMGGVRGGDEYAQNTLYGILKEKFKRKHTNS